MTITINNPRSELSEYFNSIRDEFKGVLAAQKKKSPLGSLTAVAVILLVFSGIPILPYIAVLLSRWMKLAPLIHGEVIPLQSFWFWWIFLVVLLSATVYLFVKLKGRKKEGDQLSTPQMRFALTYAIFDELSDFQKNSRPVHIQRVLEFEEELFKIIPHVLSQEPLLDGRPPLVVYDATGEVHAYRDPLPMLQRFGWFKLDPKTERILRAFREVRRKIHDRIKDKKDLSAVVQLLQSLALYFYTEIPEKQNNDKTGENSSVRAGEEALEGFASAVEQLSPYSSERPRPTVEEKLHSKASIKFDRFAGLFMHPNLLICFISWLLFLGILVCGSVWITRHLAADLKIDSTLVALMIGAPIAGAATLTVLSRPRAARTDVPK